MATVKFVPDDNVLVDFPGYGHWPCRITGVISRNWRKVEYFGGREIGKAHVKVIREYDEDVKNNLEKYIPKRKQKKNPKLKLAVEQIKKRFFRARNLAMKTGDGLEQIGDKKKNTCKIDANKNINNKALRSASFSEGTSTNNNYELDIDAGYRNSSTTQNIHKNSERKSNAKGTYTKSSAKETYTKSNAQEAYTKSSTQEAYTKSNAKGTYTKSNARETFTKSNAQGAYTRSNAQETYTKSNAKGTYTKSNVKETFTKSNAQEAYTRFNAQEAYTRSNTQEAYTRSNAQEAYTKITPPNVSANTLSQLNSALFSAFRKSNVKVRVDSPVPELQIIDVPKNTQKKLPEFQLVSSNVYQTCVCQGTCQTDSCACVGYLQECEEACQCSDNCSNMGLTVAEGKRLFLATSEVHGTGCFANEDIKKGEFVGEYVGEIISKFHAKRKKNQSKYLFLTGDKNFLIDASRCGSKLTRMNHKDENSGENCRFKLRRVGGAWRVGVWALEDISEGVELFASYGDQYWE